MRERGIAALIVPGTDPHSSEYIAAHWQERSFISAFTGSAGTAVITLDGGCLWTDSRYFLQAAEQLKKSGLQLQKDGVIGTPDIATWLGSTLKNGDTVAVNPAMFSINGMRKLESQLAEYGISINTNYDFISDVWKERPALPDAPVMVFDEKYTGRSIGDKLAAQLAQYASETDMDNLINLFACSALFDIWVYDGQSENIEDMIEPEQYRSISIVVTGIYVNSFKDAYAQGLESGDYDAIVASLRHIAVALPADTMILPGHGGRTTMKDETAYNPYFRI